MKSLLILLALSAPSLAEAASPIGFVDGMNAAGAVGWACAPGSAQPVSIAAYVDNELLGVFPTTVPRPDTAGLCGLAGAPNGFQIGFDRSAQAQFAGHSHLLLYAMAPGLAPYLLPGSNARASNPYPLPAGTLQGVNAAGQAVGQVAGVLPPRVQIFAGAPAGEGGSGGPAVWASPVSDGLYQFSLQVPPPPAGAGTVLPLFGYAADAQGVLVPLMNPLALIPGSAQAPSITAAPIRFSARVSQSGAMAGIRNTVFTAWLPPGQAFAGLSGQISLAGNRAGFSEALVLVGYGLDPPASCLQGNGAPVQTVPTMSRLWSGILKNTGTTPVSLPVGFALPYAVPPATPATGACLLVVVSAGYAFLDSSGPMYTLTDAELAVATAPISPASPPVITMGLGGEFRFTAGLAAPSTVYVGIQASRMLHVDGAAVSLSVSPVANAPASSGWTPAAAGAWNLGTSFVYLRGTDCNAAHFQTQPSNGTVSILRLGTPALLSLPAGAVSVLRVPLTSFGNQAIQKSLYQAFAPVPVPWTPALTLNAGDCLIIFEGTTPIPGSSTGYLDVENQSTLYLRPGN